MIPEPLEIHRANLDDRRIVDLLATHLAIMRAQSPAESVHALDLAQLRAPGLSIWAVWCADELLAIGALKLHCASPRRNQIDAYTSLRATARCGNRSARAHPCSARAQGLSRLSLRPARNPSSHPRALCTLAMASASAGHLRLSSRSNSVFMTLELASAI